MIKKLSLFTLCVAILVLGALLITQPAETQTREAGIGCNQAKSYQGAGAGFVQIMSPQTATIYICGYVLTAGSATGVGLAFSSATSACTTPTAITPVFSLAAGGNVIDSSPFFRGLTAPAGNGLCINVPVANNTISALIFFSTF